MRICATMDLDELGEVLERTVADEHFIAMSVHRALDSVRPLVGSGLGKAVDAFQASLYRLGRSRLDSAYVAHMGRLLKLRFDGWDTDRFDVYLWRLLHEDVLDCTDAARCGDPTAARFWIRLLDAIASEDFVDDVVDAGPCQTGNLRAHAIAGLSRSMHQLLPLVQRNSKEPSAWSALNSLADASKWASGVIANRINLHINADLDERHLAEWLANRVRLDPVPRDAAAKLKRLLLQSSLAGKLLATVERCEQGVLERLVREATSAGAAGAPVLLAAGVGALDTSACTDGDAGVARERRPSTQ